MSGQENQIELLELTTEIVAAHVSNNTLAVNDLPQLIQDVYKTLVNVGNGQVSSERLQPAISIKKSITPDFIICLEDGKKLKMLKRHLKTAYNNGGCRETIQWWRQIMPSTAALWQKRLVSAPNPGAKNSRIVSPYFLNARKMGKFLSFHILPISCFNLTRLDHSKIDDIICDLQNV